MTEALLLENTNLKSEIVTLKNEVENLTRLLVTMKREKFGRKSEIIIDEKNPQRNLFFLLGEEDQFVLNEAEAFAQSLKDEDIEIKPYKRKKKKTKISDLPIDETIVVDVPESDKKCPIHGADLPQIATKEVVKIEYTPAIRKVIKLVYPIYGACNEFCDLTPSIAPCNEVLPDTAATPSLLTNLIVSKYELGLPLYRIEKEWEQYGIDITRATMSRWLIELYSKLGVIKNLMTEDLLADGYLQADETFVQVLKINGEKKDGKSYAWVRYNPLRKIISFDFFPTRAGYVAKELFKDFQGFLQVDGYKGYNCAQNGNLIEELGCWYHARKYFFVAYKDGKSQKALECLKMIKLLFRIEKIAIERNLSFDERKKLRDEQTKPLIEKIKAWVDKTKQEVLPKSPLGQALTYILNQWQQLIVFLKDGRLEISNNWVENKIRPFTVGRKNWLFFDTDNGADAGCFFYSLIETAKANGLNRRDYFMKLLEDLPKAITLADFEKLLPYPPKSTTAIDGNTKICL